MGSSELTGMRKNDEEKALNGCTDDYGLKDLPTKDFWTRSCLPQSPLDDSEDEEDKDCGKLNIEVL
jgi:hypothetical protein